MVLFSLSVLSLLSVRVLRVFAQDSSPASPTTGVGPPPPAEGLAAISPEFASNQVAHYRDIFFVGGKYQFNQTYNGSLIVDQIYVEKLYPASGVQQPHPLVLFHGGGSGGTLWLNTPDNRKGWASYFLEQGYVVYIIDQTSVGRSTSEDLDGYPLRIGFTAELAELGFTRMEDYNLYPQAKLHTQWPGPGTPGSPEFEAFIGGFIPLTSNKTRQQLSMRDSGCTLLNLTGPAFILSHSIGSVLTTVIADACPELVVGNIGIEPTNYPFKSYEPDAPTRAWGLADIPLAYDPPVNDPAAELLTEPFGNDVPERRSCVRQKEPARKLSNLSQVPNLILTGEASQHAALDHCIVEYLQQTGSEVEWVELAKAGIPGNGHFMFIEKNNMDIVPLVRDWMVKQESK